MATLLGHVEETLDRLAAFTNESAPVVSLYLDVRADQHGHRQYADFVERGFKEHIETFDPASPARPYLENDAERIGSYLENELQKSARSVAIFSCSGDPNLFEAVQLEAPVDGHRLYIDRKPHLFALARLSDQYATYAALLVDTHAARLYVLAVGGLQRKLVVENEKPTRTPGVDVFSEGEYKRNSETLHLRHMKEVAAVLDRVVREEGVVKVFVAADSVARPLLRDEVSDEMKEKMIEISDLDMSTPDAEVLHATLAAFREADARSDRDDIVQVLNAFRARGLGTVGLPRVKAALVLGQVDRLFLPAIPAISGASRESTDVHAAVPKGQHVRLDERTIEELVKMARQTASRVTFIEDPSLLTPAGGVAAFLRFRLSQPAQ
jgi:peptide subunit release factor 1 (eRF1)